MNIFKRRKEITLYYPPKRINELQAHILYSNSDSHGLATRYSGILENMRKDGVKILLEPIHDSNDKSAIDDLEYTRKLVNLFMASNKLIKLDWARVDALIEVDPRNISTLLNFIAGESGKDIMHEIAQNKYMAIDECWKKLGNKTVLNFDRGYYYYESDLPKMWRDSRQTKFLNNVVNFESGPIYSDKPKENVYNAEQTVFLIPKKALVIWDISTRHNGKPTLRGIESIDDKECNIFSGADFLSQLPIFAGLKNSGIIKAGVTKVPISVAKKISSLMTLKSLPKFKYTISDRNYMLADLGGYASPEAVATARKKAKLADADNYAENLLRSMYACIFDDNANFMKYLLSDSASKLSKNATESLVYILTQIFKAVNRLMQAMPTAAENRDEGAWVSFQDVIDFIEYDYATSGNYWKPTLKFNMYDVISRSENFSYPDFYPRFQMPMIQGIFQMMAAMGMMDLAYTKHTALKYLRITNAGLWITDRVKQLKIEMQKVDDGLVFDPDTLMFTIRDTNSPNLALLDDLADKVTTNRYKVTQTSLLRDCKTHAELSARVERLQKYLLGGDKSPVLERLISKLYKGVNKVHVTTGQQYICMDVDPNDKELHQFLISTPIIRKNTLRVEGWKLLVKKSFYSAFINKLKEAGYLTES